MIRQARAWRTCIYFLIAAAFLVAFDIPKPVTEAGQPAVATSGQSEAQRLVGRWVRPDGGYVLELRDATKGGGLKAAYFNPRPINVAKAEWRQKDNALTVFVELRDLNYPGSTYTLQYDPASDRLKGTYFQAVEKQTFAIEFARGQ
jgi:hypothetical protein